MSQDINHSHAASERGLESGDTIATHHQGLSDLDGELAVVEVKEDGSFYLEAGCRHTLSH